MTNFKERNNCGVETGRLKKKTNYSKMFFVTLQISKRGRVTTPRVGEGRGGRRHRRRWERMAARPVQGTGCPSLDLPVLFEKTCSGERTRTCVTQKMERHGVKC